MSPTASFPAVPLARAVRETCHFLIDQLTADDYLGIVSYSNTVREDVPLLRMTPEARRLAHTMISSLTLHGGTALYAGLEAGVKQQMAAASELKALAAAAGGGSDSSRIVHSCFLFTDGQATTGRFGHGCALPYLAPGGSYVLPLFVWMALQALNPDCRIGCLSWCRTLHRQRDYGPDDVSAEPRRPEHHGAHLRLRR